MQTRNWLARNALTARTQLVGNTTKRAFSQSIRPPQVSNTGLYMLGGLGVGGIVYTIMKGRQMTAST
jgi:hypothetical protein